MKKFLKWTGIVLLFIIAGLYTVILLRQNRTFDAPYPDIKATNDSAVIARGEHLVFGPAHCANCHAAPDKQELVEKGERVPLAGGFAFDIPIGQIYAKNLTPHETGIGNMTDAEIARTLRYGVNSKGKALFDFMPFHNTSDDDLVAIISYLRKQQPVNNPVPKNDLNVLGQAVNAFLLDPVGPSEKVPAKVTIDTTVEYGKYLANSVANCRGCHTNRDLMTGAFIGEDYAGGLEMETETDSGTYIVITPNLTPDDATGHIRGWSRDQFIKRFRAGTIIQQTHMPWGPFSQMSDNELKAIYKFLQTVKPVHHEVKQTVTLKNN